MADSLVVSPEEAGGRIDVIIARASGASRSAVARAVHDGTVRLNGTPVKGSTVVEAGDTLEFALSEVPALVRAHAEELPLSIVYEDEALLVVDKPAGMVTHPAHGARDGTLVNALLGHAANLPGDPLRPGLVHRLDRDTSGLLVVAKTDAALSALGLAMMRRFVKREYLGLVRGIPAHSTGTIEGAVGRDPNNRQKRALLAGGKPAVTHYHVRDSWLDASELIFRLETGRTHQIRVHLAGLGHPLLNDPLYGKRDPRIPLPGQALHAWRLSFRHPQTREELAFEVEPPPGYLAAREALRR